MTVDLTILEPVKTKDYLLKLEISGKEKAFIGDHTGANPSSRAERKFLNSSFVLHDFSKSSDTMMPPGWHDFPFSFHLPATMPSSMKCECSGKANTYCEIRYKIKATLRRHRHSSSSSSSRLLQSSRKLLLNSSSSNLNFNSSSAELEFDVHARPSPAELVPFHMTPVTHAVKTFGLVSQGTISFGVTLIDTHVSKGDDLEVCIAARNDSAVDLEHFRLQLHQVVEFSSSSMRKQTSSMVLAERIITDAAIGMKSNHEVWYNNTITGLDQLHDENQQFIYIELQNRESKFTLHVPADTTLDSFSGSLIKVTHYLEVKMKTSSMVDDPMVEIPLHLLDYHGVSAGSAPVLRVCDRSTSSLEEQEELRSSQTSSASRSASQVLHDAAEASRDSRPPSSYVAARPRPVNEFTVRPSRSSDRNDSDSAPAGLQRTISTAPSVQVPLEAMRAGGTHIEYATMQEEGSSGFNDSSLSRTSLSSTMSSQEMSSLEQAEAMLPSLENLLKEMLGSMDDYDILQAKLLDPEWRAILTSISCSEFGSIIAHVNLDFDQPRVAALVATQLVANNTFTCQYCKAALENTADWNRVSMTHRLLPFCCDFVQESHVLASALTPWELTLTADDFALAFSNRSS